MLLAVDARNRSVSFGFREGGLWLARGRLGSAAERSADELAFFLTAALSRTAPAAGSPGRVRAAILSSVVPALTPRLGEAIQSAFGVTAQILGPGMRTGIKIRTELPQEVGADLIASAVAARELVPGPCVIADFGAVLSFSALNGAGEFLGAAFAPGIEAAAESLRHLAALLPEVRLEAPARAIGRSSVESVRSGVVLGYGGLVERLTGLLRAELAGPGGNPSAVELIATGEALGRSLVEPLAPARFVPDLALEGLALIAARNRD